MRPVWIDVDKTYSQIGQQQVNQWTGCNQGIRFVGAREGITSWKMTGYIFLGSLKRLWS